MYRGHRRGSGGPLGGATPLGGPHGPHGVGNQPLEGWAPPLGPICLGLGGTLKGAHPLCLGGKPPPWPPPPTIYRESKGGAPALGDPIS